MKKGCLFVFLGAVFAVILIAGLVFALCGKAVHDVAEEHHQEKTVGAKVKKSAFVVKAEQLWEDYHENEVKADAKYKGTVFTVWGTVESIDKGPFDELIVRLEVGQPFSSVNAYMTTAETEMVADTKKGETVYLKCKGNGMIIGSPLLRGCVFAE